MTDVRPPGANPLMPDARPLVVAVVDGKEHFRCLPFATTLSRESCATRFVPAAKLRATPTGIKGPKLGEVTAAQRQFGYGRLARCRDCPAGKIHADELGTVARTGHERQMGPINMEATMPKHSDELPGWARGWKADGLTIERASPAEPVLVGWAGKKLSAPGWARVIGISAEGFIARARDCRAGKIQVADVFSSRRSGGRPAAAVPRQPAKVVADAVDEAARTMGEEMERDSRAKVPRQSTADIPPAVETVRRRDPFVEKAEAMLAPPTSEFTDAMREIRDRAFGPIKGPRGGVWQSGYSSLGVGDRVHISNVLVEVLEVAEGGRVRVAPVEPDGWTVPYTPTISDLLVSPPGDLLRALGYNVTEMAVPAGRVLFIRADNRVEDGDRQRG